MSQSYPASLLAVGGARTGIAPVNLLDVEDVNGNHYYWADRPMTAPSAMGVVSVYGTSIPWDPTLPGNAAYPFGPQSGDPLTTIRVPVAPGVSYALVATGGINILGVSDPAAGLSGYPYPSSPYGTYPASYIPGNTAAGPPMAYGLMGSFTDAAGNVLLPVGIGAGATVTAPSGAAWLQMGINSEYDFGATGEWLVSITPWLGLARNYDPWLLSVPNFSFHRSLQTDMGSFVVQNLSGDTLGRDVEKILRRSAIEGAMFVWRLWQPDAQAAWFEVHGTLNLDDGGVDTVQLRGAQLLNPSQDDTPLEIFCETCQLQWGGPRCGSTEATECSYSYPTCQVIERPMVVMNDYEKNFGDALANTAQQVINRARKF